MWDKHPECGIMRDNLSMTYWGWRPVVCYIFISVLVFGCTDEDTPSTPEPIELPPVTLTVITPGLNPTRSPALPSVSTISPQITLSMTLTNDLYPLEAAVQTPTCYPTPQNAIICLGKITNTRAEPIGRVSLWAMMFNQQGRVIQEQQVFVLQHVIYPGDFAPYRILFYPQNNEDLIDQFGGISVVVHQSSPVSITPPPIEVENQTGTQLEQHYLFSADVVNQSDTALEQARLVITLLDEQDHVIGFRLVEIGRLSPNERKPVEIIISPVVPTSWIRHVIHIEAQ